MVIKLRPAVGFALIWLAAVAGVSATAWYAIDRAGRSITGSEVSAISSLPLATTTGPTGSSGEPTAGTTGSATRGPSAGPTPRTSTPRTSTPRTSTPTSRTNPAATAQDRSIKVAGGQVSVRCTGATILLRIAQPDNGWQVEVEESDTRRVKVKFKRGEDHAEGESRVEAVCVNGVPALTVESGS